MNILVVLIIVMALAVYDEKPALFGISFVLACFWSLYAFVLF